MSAAPAYKVAISMSPRSRVSLAGGTSAADAAAAAASAADSATSAADAATSETNAATSETNAAASETSAAASAAAAAYKQLSSVAGTSAAYTASSGASLSTIIGGFFSFVPHVTCAAGATVAVDSAAAAALLDADGVAVTAGALLAGREYHLIGTSAGLRLSAASGAVAVHVSPSRRYLTPIVSADGYALSQVDTWGVAGQGPQTDSGVFAHSTGHGTRIELDATLQAITTSTVPYAGPYYDGCVWARNPYFDGSGVLNCEVNLPKSNSESDWLPTTITASGLQITAAMAAQVYGVSLTIGNSISRGATAIGDTGYAITTTAVDTGYALMPDASNVTNDTTQIGPNTHYVSGAAGLKDLAQYGLTGDSAGESHVASMTKAILATMLSSGGAKIPIVAATMGQGGHRIAELGAYFQALVAGNYPSLTSVDNRMGGVQPGYTRYLHRVDGYAQAAGRKSWVLPPVLIVGGNDDISDYMSAATMAGFLQRGQKHYSDNARRMLDWPPQAPDLPAVLAQNNFPSQRMTPSWTGSRVYGAGADSSSLAMWQLAQQDPRAFVLTSPYYWVPAGADGTHAKYYGYFRWGEMIAVTMAELILGVPKRPQASFTYRISSTQFAIGFSDAEGGLALDTTNVSQLADGAYGLVLWDLTTGLPVTITGVSVGTDTGAAVIVTHSDITSINTHQFWVDYGLWADAGYNPSSSGYHSPNTNPGGPRGCIRCVTAHASTLPSYTDPATGSPFAAVNNYRWPPAFRVRVHGSTGATINVNGELP